MQAVQLSGQAATAIDQASPFFVHDVTSVSSGAVVHDTSTVTVSGGIPANFPPPSGTVTYYFYDTAAPPNPNDLSQGAVSIQPALPSLRPDRFAGLSSFRRSDHVTDPEKVSPNDEIHGYDALERLESEPSDGAPRQARHGDSAYEQLWLGKEGFHSGQ